MKKETFIKTLLLFISSLVIHSGYSQFVLNGEFRPRFEFRNGYKSLAYEESVPAIFVSQRSRLAAELKKDKYSVGFSIQDVRVWGDEDLYSSTGMFGNNASIDLYQAWISMQLCKNASIKIGRQLFSYDDQRLLSARNWNQNGITYDAILFQKRMKNIKIDVALSLNNNKENTFGNEYTSGKIKTLNFLYLEAPVMKDLRFAGLFMAVGKLKEGTKETVYVRGNYGGNFYYNHDNLNVKAGGFYQTGKNARGGDVGAWMYNAEVGYKAGIFSAGAGAEVLSGDDPDDPGKDQMFDLFYGARHKYYGYLDYFSNLPVATAGGGLTDLFFRTGVIISEKHNVLIDYHYFMLSQDAVVTSGETTTVLDDRSLGNEIDLTYKVNLLKDIQIQAGYSFFLPESTMKEIAGVKEKASDISQFAYIMITVKPEFFRSEK